MYFNRTKFNRITIISAKANIKSCGYLKAVAYIHYKCNTAVNSKSKIKANIEIVSFINGNINAKSAFKAICHTPVYTIGNIKSKAYINGTCYKSITTQGNYKGVPYFKPAMYVNNSISSVFDSDSDFIAYANKTVSEIIFYNSKSCFIPIGNVLRGMIAFFNSKSKLNVSVKVLAVEIISFENINFSPKDIIEIDLCNQYATLNGENIMDKWTGDFFKFYPDDNTFVWLDEVENTINERNIDMKIRFQNRYL